MKTKIFRSISTLALILIPLMISDSCKKEEPKDYDIYVVDVSSETDWDYWVVTKDGGNMLIQTDNYVPSVAYFKPAGSDDGYAVLFDGNGVPKETVFNNHIFFFSNYRKDLVDISVVLPNGEISLFQDIAIQYDFTTLLTKGGINWANNKDKIIKYAGWGLGAVACAAGIAATLGTGGLAVGLAVLGCTSTAISIAADILPEDYMLYGLSADAIGTIGTVAGCTSINNPASVVGCVAGLGESAANTYSWITEWNDQHTEVLGQAIGALTTRLVVSTNAVTEFNNNSATVGGEVITDIITQGQIIERGIYWGTVQNPVTNGTKLKVANGSTSFSTPLSGLTPNTTYYVVAYATNALGTSYGKQVSFTTNSGTQVNSFTTESYDLNNNLVPNGWKLIIPSTIVVIENGKLIAKVVDSYGYLRRLGTVPNDVTKMKFEWDGNLSSTVWGMCNNLQINFSTSYFRVYLQTSSYVWGTTNNKLFFLYNPGNKDQTIGSWLVPYKSGEFHYTVTIDNSQIRFVCVDKATNSSYVDQIMNIPPATAFNLSQINSIDFIVNATTDNNNWLDNISITLIK